MFLLQYSTGIANSMILDPKSICANMTEILMSTIMFAVLTITNVKDYHKESPDP